MASNAKVTEDSVEEIQVVVFTLGEEFLCLDIKNVREIIRIPDITRVPRSSPFIEGVINLRGQIKTVLNLKKRIGLKKTAVNEDGRIIIAENDARSYGMLVDSVLGVFGLSVGEVSDPSTVLGGENAEFILGIGKIEDKLVLLGH
jgi:purine-binding chemotaxis protein CheW